MDDVSESQPKEDGRPPSHVWADEVLDDIEMEKGRELNSRERLMYLLFDALEGISDRLGFLIAGQERMIEAAEKCCDGDGCSTKIHDLPSSN